MNNQLSTIKFDKSKYNKVQNKAADGYYHPTKPQGGFWTSTKLENGKSDWLEFCEKYYEAALTGMVVEYAISPEAKVLEANSPELEKYVVNGKIDWENLSQDYDGFHWDWNGRFAHFDMWDVESTVWFNPDVLSVK